MKATVRFSARPTDDCDSPPLDTPCWCDVIEDDVPYWGTQYYEHDDVPHWDRYKDRHRCGRSHDR